MAFDFKTAVPVKEGDTGKAAGDFDFSTAKPVTLESSEQEKERGLWEKMITPIKEGISTLQKEYVAPAMEDAFKQGYDMQKEILREDLEEKVKKNPNYLRETYGKENFSLILPPGSKDDIDTVLSFADKTMEKAGAFGLGALEGATLKVAPTGLTQVGRKLAKEYPSQMAAGSFVGTLGTTLGIIYGLSAKTAWVVPKLLQKSKPLSLLYPRAADIMANVAQRTLIGSGVGLARATGEALGKGDLPTGEELLKEAAWTGAGFAPWGIVPGTEIGRTLGENALVSALKRGSAAAVAVGTGRAGTTFLRKGNITFQDLGNIMVDATIAGILQGYNAKQISQAKMTARHKNFAWRQGYQKGYQISLKKSLDKRVPLDKAKAIAETDGVLCGNLAIKSMTKNPYNIIRQLEKATKSIKQRAADLGVKIKPTKPVKRTGRDPHKTIAEMEQQVKKMGKELRPTDIVKPKPIKPPTPEAKGIVFRGMDKKGLKDSIIKDMGISFSRSKEVAGRFTPKEGKIEERVISKDAKLARPAVFREFLEESLNKQLRSIDKGKEMTPVEVRKDVIRQLREEGYDGADLSELSEITRETDIGFNTFRDEQEIFIINPDVIKTQQPPTPEAKLIEEAKKYKTAEAFVDFMRGSATQYRDYNPQLRAKYKIFEDSERISELGINPEKEITIYRGVVDTKTQEINDGDFVTVDRLSAESYAGKENVVSKKVKAKDLIVDSASEFNKDRPFELGAEFIYSDSKNKLEYLTDAQLTNIWEQAQEEKVIKKPKPKTQEEIRGLPKRAEKIIKDLRKEEATARQRKIAQDTLRVLTDKIKEYRHQVIPYEKGYLQEEYNELDFYFRGKEGMTLDVVAIELEIEGDMEARDYLNNLLEQRDSLRQEIKDTKAAYETRKKVTILKQRLSDIQQGIKTGQKLTAKEIKRTQEKVIKVLEIADLTAKDKAKFIRTIKNIQTRQQFEKNIPKIQERIIELVEKQQRRILKSQINKELKKTKVKKQAGKPVGKFTPEIQKALDVMRNANKVKVSEAQELLNRSLSKQPDEISVYDKIANQIFVVKAGVADVATMRNTLKGIIELKEKGRKANLLKGEQLKEEKEQAIKETIDIITGGKGKTWSKTSTIKEFQESKIRGRIAQFAKSQVGWQDLLDILSYNAPGTRGESFLNEFGDIFGEKIAEKKGTRVAFEEIRELGRKAFGFEKDSQFAERLMKDLQDTFTYTGTNVKGEKIFIEMNRTQVRKRYMEIQDPSLIEMITHEEGMAYTSDIIQAMERFLTKEDKAFVEAQMKFYKNYYKKVNKVYRDIYGVDLPFNEFYSPIAREGVETDIEGVTALMQEIKQRISTTTGSLKSRVSNFHKLKDQSDTTVLQKHIIDMEHFMAWSKKLKKIKSVFGNPDVKTAITLYYGNGMNRQLSSFLQDFTRGGIEAGKRVAGLDRIRGNFARSVLAIKPSIAIKQLTSFLAYMEAMPTIDFVSGQMDFWKHPIENSKILLGSEYMKARGQSVTRDLKTAMQSDEFQNFRGNPNFWNSLMLNIQLGDKGAILMGGWSLYKYNLKQGKTHEQALRAFEEFSDRTQQSGDLDQLSVIQRGGSWAKLFTMFKSAPQQYFRKELAAVKDIALKKGAYKSTKAWKTILIYHIILPGLFQFVANGFRWDDDDQRRAAILGPLNGIPLVGDGIEYLIRIVLGQMTWDLANPLLAPFKEIGGAFDALADMREEGISIEDMKRAISGILSVTGVTIGAPLESTFNMGFGLWKLGTGQTTTAKGLKELAGWSEWVIERKDEKKKRKIEF